MSSQEQPVDQLTRLEKETAIFLAMMDDLGAGRTNALPLSGGGPQHNLNAPMPAPRRGTVHSGVAAWNAAVFGADTAADEGKESIMDGQLHRMNRMAAQGQSFQSPVQRGQGSVRGGRGSNGVGPNNIHSRGAIGHANIRQWRRPIETNNRAAQLIASLDKKPAKPAQTPKVAQAPKGTRPSRPVRPRREVFGPAITLATPAEFFRCAAIVFGKPAAAPIKAATVVKNEAPISTKEEAVAPGKQKTFASVQQDTIVRVKEDVISDTKTITASTPELPPVKGLECSKYASDEYKAAHAALSKSSLIANAAKAKASIHSSASQFHGAATVKPVVNLPMEDEYNHVLTRKWGGRFSMDDGPVQEATIIYFTKDPSGPSTLRLVVTIDGKPVSVFSQVVPKDVAVIREDGITVLLGPFFGKGAECCTLWLQTDQSSHTEAFYNAVTHDPYRPAESRVESEVIDNHPETEASSQVSEVTSIDMSIDDANQDDEQVGDLPKIFDSCFDHHGVPYIFAIAVEKQYEGTFWEYLFKTFNNSTLQPDDAKEAILESVELVAGAEQMVEDFTRSSVTFNKMVGIGASGPPRGFGKKVLAELLVVRDALSFRKAQVSSPKVKESASKVEQPASNDEQPAMQDESSHPSEEMHPTKEMSSKELPSKEIPSEEMFSGRGRQQSTPKPPGSSDTAPAPSASVAAWNNFATTASSLPVSSPPHAVVRLPTANTVPAPSTPDPVSFTVPDPPLSQVKGGKVFPHSPSGNANQTSKSLAPVGNLTRGPMPSSVSNNQVLAASPSGMPDTVLGDVIASSIVKKEDLKDTKTVSENLDAKLAKLPKLGESRFGPMGDKGGNLQPTANRPMPFQPKALTSRDDKLEKQLQPTANRPMPFQPKALTSRDDKLEKQIQPTANRPMPFQPKALTSRDDKLEKQLQPTANRPMLFQPKALTSRDDKLKKQLQPTANRSMASQPNALPSGELKKQLELARQLQAEFGTSRKNAQYPKTSRAAPSNPSAYNVTKQAQRNSQEQISGQVAHGGFPQQQERVTSFPPREDMHARKESTDSSDTEHKSRGPQNGKVNANTNVNAVVFSQKQALQAQYRATHQPRR